MQIESLTEPCAEAQLFSVREGEYEEAMVYTDYMWVDISDWEFGRMHEELRALSTQGWEVDGVIDDARQAPAATGGSPEATVNLRLKRQRKY